MGASVPHNWAKTLTVWFACSRYFRVCQDSFRLLSRDSDVTVHHPFIHPAVLATLARAGGIGGFGTRTESMHALFADALPLRVIQRQTKGGFTTRC